MGYIPLQKWIPFFHYQFFLGDTKTEVKRIDASQQTAFQQVVREAKEMLQNYDLKIGYKVISGIGPEGQFFTRKMPVPGEEFKISFKRKF